MLKKALITCTVAMFAAVGVANAGIPDCDVSIATGGGDVNISPLGNADVLSLNITVLDAFSNPIIGLAADSICVECPGVSPAICADAATDSSGATTITYSAGGITDGYCELVPVTIKSGPNTCTLDVSSRANPNIRFFDINGGGAVDLCVGTVDFGVFGICWLQSSAACQKVNYDASGDGLVGTVDFGLFGIHWLEGCR